MHVFVTGATGFVGTQVVKRLLGAGHHVTGLARSDGSAAKLKAAGADVLRGDLTDRDSLVAGTKAADAVIHTAFIHDFANFAASAETDRRAIETMGAALAGSGRPLLVTSGTGLAAGGEIVTEDTPAATEGPVSIRAATENVVLALAEQGVGAAVVRLPPTVHGAGDHGFVPILIDIARQKGVSAYVDAGENTWAAVHVNDAARVYVLALENGGAGVRHHAVAEEGTPFREIAGAIGRGLDLPVKAIAPDEAADHFGWFAHFAQMGVRASSRQTQERLGWQPTGPGLIADMEGCYFAR